MTADELQGRARTRYEAYTGKASEIVRSLALAGLGLAWLFSGGLTTKGESPQAVLEALQDTPVLYWAAILAVLALAADLWQYALSAMRWGILHWALDQVLLNDRSAILTRRGRLGWALLRWFGYAERIIKDRRTRTHYAAVAERPWAERRAAFRAALGGDLASSETRVVLTTWQPASLGRPALWLWSLKLLATSAVYVALLMYLVKN